MSSQFDLLAQQTSPLDAAVSLGDFSNAPVNASNSAGVVPATWETTAQQWGSLLLNGYVAQQLQQPVINKQLGTNGVYTEGQPGASGTLKPVSVSPAVLLMLAAGLFFVLKG